MEPEIHKPVLLKEVLDALNPKPGETYFDGTINGGGHAMEILRRVGRAGKVIGFDWDGELIERLRMQNPETNVPNLKLVAANYKDAKKIFAERGWGRVNGILLDIGFSSYHIELAGRGFSFRKKESLDMRYSSASVLTAYTVVNTWSKENLAEIIRTYGEERFAEEIAGAIVNARKQDPIKTSLDLAKVIEMSVPKFYRRGRIHPATRTFQALRIVVNGELENLRTFLDQAADLLLPGGTLALITFHSLEDRMVKYFFKEHKDLFSIINKKVIRASREERLQNPRAEAAKLRVARKN